MSAPILSLVVSTLGRDLALGGLLDSLEAQSCRDFEVVVVDQNTDDRLGPVLSAGAWTFPLRRIRRPGERGLSRGRNVGWRASGGGILLFPDDDCWYPPDFLARGLALLEESGADIVSGRAADETGRSINGRYAPQATDITRRNVWITQIEWVAFFRRAVLEAVNGYDETIGVGAASPWQSCEGPDIVLRALAAGFRGRFDPALFGHHAELDTREPDAAMRRKGRAYARGMGYVLRRHGYPPGEAAYWCARSLANMGRALIEGSPRRTGYFAELALGRAEGWLKRTLP
ncbi:MAG: glycosyltransferase family 2 protein [Alphaproteobacteria bacterium]|nr:glycosyltransferase family 2 protein [Alphaproteobacteria bacterium]